MVKIRLDVEGVDKTLENFSRDFHRGMENAAETLADNAISKARNVISTEQAIFNAEVYKGFKTAETRNNRRNVRVLVYNKVEHAGPLEHGVEPAQYADGGPPVQALLPWVERKMDWSPDGDDWDFGSGGGSDGGGGGGGSDDDSETEALTHLALGDDVDIFESYGTSDIVLRDRKGVQQNLRKNYGKDANEFYNWIEDWKSGGSKDLVSATGYSMAMKRAFGIDAKVRGIPDQSSYNSDHVEIARSLGQVSEDFLKIHYDTYGTGKIQTYRTLRDESPRLSKRIWEDPGQDSWEIPTNAVNNYTTTQSNLEGFDRSLLHSPELDIEDDVLIAIDALIHSTWEHEGEIHVRGSDSFTYQATDLDFQSSTYSDSVDYLTDQFFEDGNFNSFTDDQMGAIASTIRVMGKERTTVGTDDGKKRVHNFVDEFIERGLESNTDYDKQKWRKWESLITGDGEILEFDKEDGDTVVRSYEDGWRTYDPTKVDRVPLEDTYETQEVEIFNVDTEEFAEAHITGREKGKQVYEVKTSYGDEYTIKEPYWSGADPWKIVAVEDWDTLDDSDKEYLILEAVDNIDYRDFDSNTREREVQHWIGEKFSESLKDQKLAYDILHRTKAVGKYTGPDSSIAGQHSRNTDGTYSMTIASKAERSTAIHEMFHGVHKQYGYTDYTYPDNDDDDWFNNLWNEDGSNASGNRSWTLHDVLLKKSGQDPPGLADDGSVPEIIKRRATVTDHKLNWEEVDDSSELLNPTTGDVTLGDSLKISTQVDPKSSYFVKGTDQIPEEELPELDFAGDSVTVIELIESQDFQKKDIWVDDNGEFVNMKGLVVHEYAEQNTQNLNSVIPDVTLSEGNSEDRLMEAVNLAFMEQTYIASVLERGEEARKSYVPLIGREYSTRSPAEVFTSVTELLRMDSPNSVSSKGWHSEENLRRVIIQYPYLVDAWLEENNPSEDAKKVLEAKGYDL